MGGEKGQTTLEVLLIAIFGFILVGAIIGNRRDGGGIPAAMKRAAPKLGKKIERGLETGEGFATSGGASVWGIPPREAVE